MQAAPRETAREDVSAKAVNNLAQASYKNLHLYLEVAEHHSEACPSLSYRAKIC